MNVVLQFFVLDIAVLYSYYFVCVLFLFFQYKLRLRAFDSLHDGYTVVKIVIKDVNDLPPKFSQDTYTTTILEEDNFGLPKYILPVFPNPPSASYSLSIPSIPYIHLSTIII